MKLKENYRYLVQTSLTDQKTRILHEIVCIGVSQKAYKIKMAASGNENWIFKSDVAEKWALVEELEPNNDTATT